MRVGILSSHPIQYQAPWFRSLARELELEVFFAHKPTPEEQSTGFGGAFEWDVDLLSGYKHQFLVNQARYPSTSRFFGCDTPEVSRLISPDRFDAFIVSGWNLKAYWQAIRACRKAHVPVLVRGDSQLRSNMPSLKRMAKQLIYPRMLRQFDGFLSVGERNRQYLRSYGVQDEKIFFVPHFVDSNWFAIRADQARCNRNELRSMLGATDQTLVVLFVGKFVPKKRPQDALEAAGLLARSGTSVACVLVGSGALESELRTASARLGITAAFEGFRNQTEVPRYYDVAHVLVLPSDAGETWGLVVNEAMACGRPAIVSDAVGCVPDLIDEGRTGFSFPVGDTSALADRLESIATMYRDGFDFAAATAAKMNKYSLEAATQATIEAVNRVRAACSTR
jgi:glycosyltransferase involved in cell wall biosynthesis